MHLYGLIIGIAFIIGFNFFSANNKIIPKNKETLFLFGIIISAIIGARAYHVIDQWSFYSQNPWLIPQTWNGGLGIFGGIFGAIIFITLFAFKNKLSTITIFNSISPIMPLCQAIGRLGNYVNHENPVWWLEAILDVLLFIIINRFPNNPTAKYLIGYGVIRFFTEFYRADTWIYQETKVGQIIGLLFILFGFILYRYEILSQRTNSK